MRRFINTKSIIRLTKNFMPIWLLIACCLFNSAFAASAGDTQALTDVVKKVEGNVLSIARLLVLISYVAGIGFAMAGVLQFKAYKDNPQQTPLSKPIVYLCVGAFLIFLPSLMGTAGKSIFGSSSNPTSKINLDEIKTTDGSQ